MAEQVVRHTDRHKAESFGSIAENYDTYRPSYPSALIDDLVAGGPESVLDVGCGTGKVAALFAARGLDVLGVEIDERMADVARRHGIEVEIGAFETWDDRGRSFDLLVAGQAWHWIDPAAGVPKAARLVRPGGTVAIFWSADKMREPLASAVDSIYRRHVPDVMATLDAIRAAHHEKFPHAAQLEASGLFDTVEVLEYPTERRDTAAHWIGLARTTSDHVTMAPDVREPLLVEVSRAIDDQGGVVINDVTTHLIRAKRGVTA